MAQLALPPQYSGEALPYRPPFVFGGKDFQKNATDRKALVCLKIDPAETVDGRARYVPLRTGKVSRVQLGTDSTALVRISYVMGLTPDFTRNNRQILGYSDRIRAAVGLAAGSPDVSDQALAVVVNFDFSEFEALSADDESDRWIQLTRMLADSGGEARSLLNKLRRNERQAFRRIYKQIAYIRWAGISTGNQKVVLSADRFEIDVDKQYTADILSSILPLPQLRNRLIRWHLTGSSSHFDFLGFSEGIGAGVVPHQFPFEAKRASKRPLTLRVSPVEESAEGLAGIHLFDVHLPVRPEYTWPFRMLFLALIIVIASGVVLAAGIWADDWATLVGFGQKDSSDIAVGSAPVGAGLLILGALGTYILTTRRGA